MITHARSKSSAAGTVAVATLAWDHIVDVSATILIVGVVNRISSGTTPAITAVTFNGLPLTKAVSATSSINRPHSSIWYLKNPPVGEFEVLVTSDPTKANQYIAGISTTLYGVHRDDPIVDTASSYTFGSFVTTLTMDTIANAAIYGFISCSSAVSASPSGSQSYTKLEDVAWETGLSACAFDGTCSTPTQPITWYYTDSESAPRANTAITLRPASVAQPAPLMMWL